MAGPVVLGQTRHQHCADGDVDAHTQSIGAANNLEKALLGQALNQAPVLRQHASVVDTDSLTQKLREVFAERRGEAEACELRGNGLLLLCGDDLRQGSQRLRALRSLALGEVDDVDGRLAIGEQFFDCFVDRGKDIREVEGHWASCSRYQSRRAAGTLRQILLQPGGITQGGGHEQELGLR